MIKQVNYDISKEFFVRRYGNGIKLIKPDADDLYCHSSNHQILAVRTVAEMLKLPFNVYFMDTASIIREINEPTIQTCGFISRKEALGKTTAIVAKKETVEFEFRHDQEVLKSNEIKIKEEYYNRLKDNISFPGVAIKFPWYNADDKITGIFGCSIAMGNQDTCSLADALTAIAQTGLLGPAISLKTGYKILPGSQIDTVYLSRRETECLRLLVRGKTAKKIAHILGLSYRTVEHYLFNIKKKTKTTSKSDLIEKVMNNSMIKD